MQLFIHIGLHKTGTTVLQKLIFPKLQDIEYLGKPFDNQSILRHIINSEKNRFIYSCESTIGTLLDSYKKKGPNYLISQCCGIKRLSEIFPNANIIIGVRSHESWILSVYKHYLKYGGTEKFENFFCPSKESSIMHPDDFLFMPRINLVIELFQSNLFIYRQEDLFFQPQVVVDDLSNFLGVPTIKIEEKLKILNEGVGESSAKIIMQINKFSLLRKILNSRKLKKIGVSPIRMAKFLAGKNENNIQISKETRQIIYELYSDDYNNVSLLSKKHKHK